MSTDPVTRAAGRGARALARPASARALALLAAALLAVAVSAAPARAASTGPLAMHSMLQLNSPRPFMDAMFSAAASAGASEIRVDASLGALNNPWISTSMWEGLDDYMQLSQEYGLPVLLDFNASNDISLETCPAGVNPSAGTCAVTDLQGYYNEIAAVVQHTRGVIDDFEIVNEPDGSWAFQGTPQQYAAMLDTAYIAVHDNDPNGRVAIGGIMNPTSTSWLSEVFATPGFDAAHAFDIANVHLRDTVANLPGDVLAWRRFFAFYGDADKPLWVTEVGYPANPAYQFDPAFRGTDAASGEFEQAAYLDRAIPTLLYTGAARVFVTERDNLGGAYASEGLLGGAVSDAQAGDFDIVPRAALGTFSQLAVQFAGLPAPAPYTAPPPPPEVQAAAPAPAPASSPAPATTPAPKRATPARKPVRKAKAARRRSRRAPAR